MRVHRLNRAGSLAVILPRPLAAALSIQKGSEIDFALEDGRLFLKPRPAVPEMMPALPVVDVPRPTPAPRKVKDPQQALLRRMMRGR